MARPSVGYYKKDGTRVPSVTDVLGRFKFPDPLVGWAFKLGKQAGIAQARGEPAPRSAFEEKNDAAQAGTIAHEMLEAYVKNELYAYDGKKPPSQVWERALRGFENGKMWFAASNLEVVDTEKSLVSEKYGFGGTRDVKLRRRSFDLNPWPTVRLGDYKTSAAIYPDYLMQVAGYGLLTEECEGDEIEGYDIMRFSKPEADWEHRFYSDLTEAREAFLLLLKAYPLVLRLEDRV